MNLRGYSASVILAPQERLGNLRHGAQIPARRVAYKWLNQADSMRLVSLLALLVSASGCSLLESEDTLIVATGRVVLAETGEPAAGLSVSLNRAGGSYGSYPIVATVRTASSGTFRLEYDPGEEDRSPHGLKINDEPYDSRYTTNRASYIRGEKKDLGDIEVSRTETP